MATSKKGVKAPQLKEVEQTEAVEETAPAFDLKAYYNEPVTFELFKDNDRYKDDVYVSVNGKRYQIKRGVKVTVPRYVKIAVDAADEQKHKADALVAELDGKDQAIPVY